VKRTAHDVRSMNGDPPGTCAQSVTEERAELILMCIGRSMSMRGYIRSRKQGDRCICTYCKSNLHPGLLHLGAALGLRAGSTEAAQHRQSRLTPSRRVGPPLFRQPDVHTINARFRRTAVVQHAEDRVSWRPDTQSRSGGHPDRPGASAAQPLL
jgi:hypothetical protein